MVIIMNQDNSDYFSKPYHLSDYDLIEITERLAGKCNCRIDCVKYEFDPRSGYYFYYNPTNGHHISIAELKWNRNAYNQKIYLHERNIEEVKKIVDLEIRRQDARRAQALRNNAEAKAKAQRRRFALQKGVRIGKRLTAAAMITLALVGAIKTVEHVTSPKDDVVIAYVQETQNMHTISSVNDILLVEWANSVATEIDDTINSTPYDGVRTIGTDLKTYGFLPVVQNYYGYIDQMDSGLPEEIVGETKDRFHERFRNAAIAFDEELESSIFSECTFDNSLFANAIIVDMDGNILNDMTDLREVIGVDGKIMSADDTYRIMVKKPKGYEGEVFIHGGLQFVDIDRVLNLENNNGHNLSA